MRKIVFLLSMSVLTLMSGVVRAEALAPAFAPVPAYSLSPVSQNKWFIEVDGGYRFGTTTTSPDQISKVNSGQLAPDLYIPTGVGGSGVVDFSFGYRFYTGDSIWFPYDDVDVRYQYAGAATTDGKVELSSEDYLDNYNYTYALTQQTILVVDKLALVKIGAFIPYVQGGVGPGLNQVSAYTEVRVAGADQPRENPGFAANNYIGFAYMFGAGVDVTLSPVWTLSVGYEYDSPSNVQTGNGTETGYTEEFLTNTVKNNEVMIGFKYLFGIKSFN